MHKDVKAVMKSFPPKSLHQKNQTLRLHPYFKILNLNPFHKGLYQVSCVSLYAILSEYQKKANFLNFPEYYHGKS